MNTYSLIDVFKVTKCKEEYVEKYKCNTQTQSYRYNKNTNTTIIWIFPYHLIETSIKN